MNRQKTSRRYELVLVVSLVMLTSTLVGTLVNAARGIQVVA
jgi:hypothetical protein